MDHREYITEIERLDKNIKNAHEIINNQSQEIVRLDAAVKVQLRTIIDLGIENDALKNIVEVKK